MIKIKESEVKHFIKEVKFLLPLYSKAEKKFIRDLEGAILDLTDANPGTTIDDIAQHFGSPNEIVCNYISALDTDRLCKKLNIKVWLKRLIIVLVLATFILLSYRLVVLERAYLEFHKQTITQETTIIE